MKFLICIGGVEPSADTIRFGGRIANAFEADLAILSVQPKVPLAVRSEIRLAREKMSEWQVDSPGIAVLRAAHDLLEKEGLLKSAEGEIPEWRVQPPGRGVTLEGTFSGPRGEEVLLKLREGDIITEVNKEVEAWKPDLVIFGASRKRRFLPRLVHFIGCSMLIVKNPKPVDYELVICTDSSPASRRAEVFGVNMASLLDCRVTLLSIAKSRSREPSAMEGAERASKQLAKARVRHTVRVRVGSVVDQILAAAREDTVIVMGGSEASEVRKLFLGSKPSKVIERVQCPLLIVK